MVKPVSLSDPAFAALRREKRPGESDSDVVLRLIRNLHENQKDPLAFLKFQGTRWLSYEDHLADIEAGRRDNRDPWEDHAGP